MEIRVEHTLQPEEAARRVRAAADKIEARHEGVADDGLGGTLSKETPLGALTADWRVKESEIIVTITQKPAFLPDGTVRSMLEGGLADALEP